jgi:ABC-type multidrug transport system ATPase subunit
VIFLDEPTTGLDPRGRHTMWQAIRNLDDAGVDSAQLSVHSPDLDDVVFAVTGHPAEQDGAVR